MESLSKISQCSKSGKVLASRSSRIPVKVCNTSNKDKQDPLTSRTAFQQNAKSKTLGIMQSKMHKNPNVVATSNHISSLTPIISPNKTNRDTIIPSPTQESSFTLPRTRVKTPLPSPAESHTNVMKNNLTKESFPAHQLPGEPCSRERINAWIDHSHIPYSVSQPNVVSNDSNKTALQVPPLPVETKEQPEFCRVVSPEVSMSIIHKTDDEGPEAKASENGMVMDNAMTTLADETIALASRTSKPMSVRGNNCSDIIYPNEVSPPQNETGESISDSIGRPASPLPSSAPTRIPQGLSESEKDSNPNSSVIPSGSGSSSSSSMQSRVSEEQRIPTFVMSNQSQALSSNRNQSPACQAIAIPPKLTVASPADPAYYGSLISSVTTARTKTFSKKNNTPTYEDLFYRKKAFIAHGPSAMRSNNRETVPFSPKFTRNQPNTFINHQQHAALTRVITETVTEYEVQEDERNERKKTLQRRKRRDSSSRGKSCKKINKSKIPRLTVNEETLQPGIGETRLKAILPAQNFSCSGAGKSQNENLGPGLISPLALAAVGQPIILETIIEEPVELEAESKERGVIDTPEAAENDRPGHKRLRERIRLPRKVSMVREWLPREPFVIEGSVGKESRENKLTKNPQSSAPTAYNSNVEYDMPMSRPYKTQILTLTGHGDPHLEVPFTTCADRESVTADENDNDIDFTYRDRADYKRLLMDSETTIRYLHKLLAIQEEKLKKSTAKSQRESVSRSDIPSSNRKSQVESRESELSSVPQLNPLVLKQQKEAEGRSTIPKFDMDEFIRKWYHHFWSQDSYYVKNNCKGPYQQSQLFRLSIAARSAICEDLRNQLQNGNHILRHKFDKLKTKIASKDPDSDGARIRLLDAYRRFVRFAHHYFNESLKSVEKFDEMYMDQQRDHDKGKILYFHETRLVVQGVRYYGVFLPIRAEA